MLQIEILFLCVLRCINETNIFVHFATHLNLAGRYKYFVFCPWFIPGFPEFSYLNPDSLKYWVKHYMNIHTAACALYSKKVTCRHNVVCDRLTWCWWHLLSCDRSGIHVPDPGGAGASSGIIALITSVRMLDNIDVGLIMFLEYEWKNIYWGGNVYAINKYLFVWFHIGIHIHWDKTLDAFENQRSICAICAYFTDYWFSHFGHSWGHFSNYIEHLGLVHLEYFQH